MKVEKEERFNLSFVLTSKEIEKIIQRFDGTDYFIFKATCADKIVREFRSTDDIIKFENPPNKAIESLGINVFSESHSKKAFIHFSKNLVDNILVQLNGEEKEVIDLFEFLKEQLHSTEAWYAFVARQKFSGTFINTIVVWIFTVPLVTVFTKQFSNSENLTTLTWVVVIASILGANLLISYLWGKIRSVYFPMGAFALGQGIKRHKDKDIIRTTVIFGTLISLVTGILILFAY